MFKGEEREFLIEGNVIQISAELDTCMKYLGLFRKSARYYTDSFMYRYKCCVEDFDTLVNYFPDLYVEELRPMLQRAYNLLLPFGVFNIKFEDFASKHMDTFKRAITSYEIMQGIETKKNQEAENLGNQVGGSIQMQGGGFGLKGAAKGVAKAEAFNAGMGLIGKYLTNQTKMSKEEKDKAFTAFKEDVFFIEVYSDYCNTFLSLIQTLADCKVINDVTIYRGSDMDTMLQNLQNPMFPQEKVASSLANMISTHPFEKSCYDLLENKFGQTEEIEQLKNYFMID